MFIGLDLGTSAVKVVCSDGAEILASASAPLSTSSPHHAWSEQDPESWWQATCHALQKLGQDIPLAGVQGLALSGQMHGAVLLDAQGAVLRPAILWNDGRATDQCAQLIKDVPDIGRTAGVPPLPGFTAPKVMWIAHHEPQVFARITQVLLPKDYIGFRMHGLMATDRSDAAGTLWLNQATRDWDAPLVEACGLPMEWLPAVHDGHDQVGTLTPRAAQDTGLPSGIAIFAGGGDAATGAVSLGVTEPGRGLVSLGTSGQLFVADRVYRPNPEQYVHAYAHSVPERWFQMAAMLNGARPISWLGEQLNLDPADVVALAESVTGDRIPVFLPYLTGERSPHGDPHIRAGFFGLEDATTRAELCRAVVEAVAFCFADAAESFGDGMNALPELSVIGGGSRSSFLLSRVAAAIGKPLVRSQGSDAGPAFGAARLAACGSGALTLADLGAQRPERDRFEPQRCPAFETRLHRYRALYAALRTLPENDT